MYDVCICLCVSVHMLCHLCGRERVSRGAGPCPPPYMRQGLSIVHFRVCRPTEDSGECPEATMLLVIEVLEMAVHLASHVF